MYFAFPCLKKLKYSDDEYEQKFKNYLDLVRQWRNDEAHLSPNATEDEINTAIQIISTMYLYVVANSMTGLERSDGY